MMHCTSSEIWVGYISAIHSRADKWCLTSHLQTIPLGNHRVFATFEAMGSYGAYQIRFLSQLVDQSCKRGVKGFFCMLRNNGLYHEIQLMCSTSNKKNIRLTFSNTLETSPYILPAVFGAQLLVTSISLADQVLSTGASSEMETRLNISSPV